MSVSGGIAPRIGLVDVVDGLLDKGTVISGEATVSLAGVDLVHVALNLLVASVETMRQSGSPVVAHQGPSLLGRSAPRGSAPGAFAAPSGQSLPHPTGTPGSWGEPQGGPLLISAQPLSPQPSVDAQEDQGLAGVVLALVELIRQLLERQAVRRMEGGSLTEEEVERMGRALMELNGKMKELFAIFGLDEADVNLDLGPLGQIL